MSSLIAATVLVAISFAGTANAARSWGEVKKCALEAVLACHNGCATNAGLDKPLSDGIAACNRVIVNRTIEIGNKCLTRRGYGIEDDSQGCWDATVGSSTNIRHRRQAASTATSSLAASRLAPLMKYGKCAQELLSGTSGVSCDPFSCLKGCAPATKEQIDAMNFCLNDLRTMTEIFQLAKTANQCIQTAFNT